MFWKPQWITTVGTSQYKIVTILLTFPIESNMENMYYHHKICLSSIYDWTCCSWNSSPDSKLIRFYECLVSICLDIYESAMKPSLISQYKQLFKFWSSSEMAVKALWRMHVSALRSGRRSFPSSFDYPAQTHTLIHQRLIITHVISRH